jgi:transposase InsO family protein
MAAACVFNPPGQLNITSGNVSEAFKTWKRLFEIYLKATKNDTADTPDETQVAILLQCAGSDVVKVYDNLKFDPAEDKKKLDKVLKALEAYCSPLKNEVIASHKFWTLEYYGPFDTYLTDLKELAKECNFAEQSDRLMRDKLVFVARGNLQARLLRESDLTLEKAIQICRVEEMTTVHGKALEKPKSIDRVKHKSFRDKPNDKSENKFNRKAEKFPKKFESEQMLKFSCKFCGYKHLASKQSCPAFGKECRKCGEMNHFSKCCHNINRKKLHGVNEEGESEKNWIGAVHDRGKKTISAKMVVNNHNLIFEIDSGAEVNTIQQKYVPQDQIKPTKISLTMWNNTLEKPIGEARLNVRNPKTGRTDVVNFVIVPDNFNCLLGVHAIQELDLLTINTENFNIANVSTDQNLGDLGEVHLYIDETIQPRALPARSIPLALRDQVKEELDKMVSRGIIEPVDEPTEWVSQMAVVKKANGSLRICIDPQALNVALKREYFKLPTFDETIPMFNNAKVFSRLDVQSAFWHVRLDNESSCLVTMATPFGRYKWRRLPFGLKVSSEIFQKRLLQALEGLNGIFCVADDIVVVGCGETMEDANSNHDVNLKALQQRCVERNIKLNDLKSDIRKSEITFMGHVISDKGVSPDPSKVKAVINMPSPSDVEGVRRFCGFVQYLSRFLPNLSQELTPVRQLTHEGVPWQWSQECEDALNRIKDMISSSPVLVFYDPGKPLCVQVDSSKYGIGATLLQDGHPIEFASRTMTDAEINYAQIEKECLSVLFGLERFDQYTYGREVVVQNDHKPLASILKKPLSQSPKRLQSMILRIRRYDITFDYVPGPKLVLADTLSRAPLKSEESVKTVHNMNATQYLNISDSRLEEIRTATEEDASLQTLASVIKNGWPENYKDINANIKAYYDVKDMLSIYDGLIFKGEKIVIPYSMRNLIKQRLHAAHLGKDSMLRRAREIVYWPGMQNEIIQIADQCKICLEAKPMNQKETIIQHAQPKYVWEKLGCDLFTIENRDYLVTVDYYSGFWEIDHLPTTTSKTVIQKLKGHFARFGIPKMIISDNGPQFSSSEFKTFVGDWGIEHITSSPGYPRSNGKAESAVKAAKTMMQKSAKDGRDQYLALLEIRNTPVQGHGTSPSQLFLQRRTRTLLPATERMLKTSAHRNVQQKKANRDNSVKKYYNKTARDLKKLNKGDRVMIYPIQGHGSRWKPGEVVDIVDNRSYKVMDYQNGATYRRNRVHLRPTPELELESSVPPQDVHVDLPDNSVSGNIMDIPAQSGYQCVQSDSEPRSLECSRPKRQTKEPNWMKDYVSK